MRLGFQMSGGRVNASERRFPKHFLPCHVPRQLKQTARRVSEGCAQRWGKALEKKMEGNLEDARELEASDPLTILVDVSARSISLLFPSSR